MKNYRLTLVLVLLLVLGMGLSFFISNYPSSPSLLPSSQLTKWQKIKVLRYREAKKIYKKADFIVNNLGYLGDYSFRDLRIERWGMMFGDTGMDIYYNGTCVFSEVDSFWGGIGKVEIFHPGKWIAILQSINVKKELTKKKEADLKTRYQPLQKEIR